MQILDQTEYKILESLDLYRSEDGKIYAYPHKLKKSIFHYLIVDIYNNNVPMSKY